MDPALADAGTGVLHINEQLILYGSVLVSVALPWVSSLLTGSKVEQIDATLVPHMLTRDLNQDDHVRLVDIRSQEDVLREGMPCSGQLGADSVIHAPWYQMQNGKPQMNRDIVNDALFAFHTRATKTFILLDSHGELAPTAAKEFTKLGIHLKVYIVNGGFHAWQAAGLPSSQAAQADRQYASSTAAADALIAAPSATLNSGSSTTPVGALERPLGSASSTPVAMPAIRGGGNGSGVARAVLPDVASANGNGNGMRAAAGAAVAADAPVTADADGHRSDTAAQRSVSSSASTSQNGGGAAVAAAAAAVLPVVEPEVLPPPPPGTSTPYHGSRAQRFRPKLLDVLAEGYSLPQLREDVLGGVVVGVIALSLSMALGIASEATPGVGLVTAVVSGFLISALGGSRVNIGGPTAAFIPIVVGVAHQYGPQNLVVCTAMSGLMLVGMGAAGLGTFIKYIPRPVVTGFTAGIAAYILGTQIKDFLGLGVPGHLPEGVPVPTEFLEKIAYLGFHLDSTHLPSLALAAGSFALMRLWPASWAKVAPPQIVAVVLSTGAMALLIDVVGLDTGIETIGSHFGAGAIPSSLPPPHWPAGATLEALPGLVYPAFTIALLAAIESLMCARVSDTFIDDRHNSNTELIAQGIANIASAMFGGLPATGALARTAANVRAGGRSPVAGMVHAATVLVIMLVASPVAQYIPLPALSAVLVVVALNMGEWRNFRALPTWPNSDAQLFLIAFMLTVLQDVAVAVEFGMVAAVLLFVQEVTSSTRVRQVAPLALMPGALEAPKRLTTVPRNAVYLIVTGSLLFGAGDLLEETLDEVALSAEVNVVVVDLSNVSVMDVSGMEVMEMQLQRFNRARKHLVVCGLEQQPLQMLSRAGFLAELGRENVCRTADDALRRAAALDSVGNALVETPLPPPPPLELQETLDVLYYV